MKQDFPCAATFAVFTFKPPAVYLRALGIRRLISAVQQVLVWKTLNPSGSEKDRMLSLILYVVLSAPPPPPIHYGAASSTAGPYNRLQM